MQINKIMKNKMNRIQGLRHQSGYVVIISVVLLSAMLVATLNYFEQSTNKLQMSGLNRDSAEALLLAESASNNLYGQFVFNDDIDLDKIIDRNESLDENGLDNLPLFYMYFISDDNTIGNSKPSILQMVADGEARSNSHAKVSIANHQIPRNANNLLIQELFSEDNKAKPVLYKLDNNRKLTFDKNSSWSDAISNNDKAAVAWIELTKKPGDSDAVRIYVQAVAQVGQSKNYIQRLVGDFPGKLGPIGAANESSP